MAAGRAQGRRPELQGGGLLRSQGGWAVGTALRRGREAYQGDERILGGTAFIDQLRRAVESAEAPRPKQISLDALVARVCHHVGIAPAALAAGGRTATAAWDRLLATC